MSEAAAATGARTTTAHWDWYWETLRLPRLPNRWNPNVRFAARLVLRALPAGARDLFEVGCAPGAWMGYLARATGCAVAGCDLSPGGARATRENLRRLDVAGQVIEGDVFALAARPPARFDLVYSFGVVEHFDDLAGILRAHARLCRPGGRVVVTAPNLEGASGVLFRRASPSLLESHRVVTPPALAEAAAHAGLEVERCAYAGPLAAFVLLDRVRGRALRALGYGVSLLLAAGTAAARSRRLAGSVLLVARARDAGAD